MSETAQEEVAAVNTAEEGAVACPAMNTDDYIQWDSNAVARWCASSLQVPQEHPVIANIIDNDISGDLLPDLSFDDYKDLCDGSSHDAVRLRLCVNKLVASDRAGSGDSLSAAEDDMTAVLQNLYIALDQKLQDYSTQYSKLRSEILDVVKTRQQAPSHASAAPEFTEVPRNQPTFAGMRTPSLSRHNTTSNRSLSPIAQSPTGQIFQQPHHKSHSNSSVSIGSGAAPQKPRLPSSVSAPHVEYAQGVQASNAAANEALKQLRASKEDSCEKILKNAMKRHNLDERDWRQYVLVICYGDQERPLELNETPVTIFKTLKQQGLHPSIMLRRRGDFEELVVNGNNNNSLPSLRSDLGSNENLHDPHATGSGNLNYSVTPGGRL